MIECRDLTKKYNDLFAVDRLTLKLDKGDVYGFIGPNGSGKMTTMRMLATLLNPSWGEATVRRLLHLHRLEGNPPLHRPHARLRRVRRHEGDGVPRILRRRVPHHWPRTP
ncbi:MAG: ATP-binding cassette domain-containing protein [Gemmataceae bacterium]